MGTLPEIQAVIDKGKAEEFAGYISRFNERRLPRKATLGNVCARFRMNQIEAKRIIDGADFLVLSFFAYKPPEGTSMAEIMMASWHPVEWPDAPDSRRLVMTI
jgi:hypothetical protein